MLKDHLHLAIVSLTHRKKRSYLTIVGVMIGISAVVALLSVGRGMEEAIVAQFEKMGSNTITVMSMSGGIATPMMSLISSTPLTDRDVKTVSRVDGVAYTSSWVVVPDTILVKGEQLDTFVVGVDPRNLDEVIGESGYNIIAGRRLEAGDKYRAGVGYDLYAGIRTPEVELYDRIEIKGHRFKVVGVVEKIGNPTDDRAVYIPLDVMRDLYSLGDKVGMIYVKVEDGYDVEEVAERIRAELRKARGEEEGMETFKVSTARELLQVIGNIMNIVRAVLIGIASISLFVGGIGIMNTMYTATLERVREIGIMKAVGARKRDIMSIFLIESGVLGLMGGVLGIFIGLSIAKLVEVLAAHYYGVELIKASMNPYILGGAAFFSFAVGVLSGLLPAKNAAELNPVEALRYE